MKKIVISKEDKDNFNKSNNGDNKYIWMKIGCIIDIISTLGISVLIIFSGYIRNALTFYFLLYGLLVLIVVGAEFIGTYYGALEQFVLHKKEKKEIAYMD